MASAVSCGPQKLGVNRVESASNQPLLNLERVPGGE
jgi:hypothetical protein